MTTVPIEVATVFKRNRSSLHTPFPAVEQRSVRWAAVRVAAAVCIAVLRSQVALAEARLVRQLVQRGRVTSCGGKVNHGGGRDRACGGCDACALSDHAMDGSEGTTPQQQRRRGQRGGATSAHTGQTLWH